ncbi:MAG: glycosyltransferase, partial [Chitinophagaceae bacterium]
MRVLFIHNRYKFAGGEDVAVEMESSILQSYGHAVETLIFDNTEISGFVSKIKTGISSIYNRESAARVKACIKVFNPDVIHVHNLFFLASPSVLYAAKKSGIPVVFTLHNYRLICANALLLRENKVCELCVNQTYPTAGIRYKCYRNSAPETALVTAVTSIHKFRNTWNEQVDKYIALTEFGRTRFENSSLKATKGKIQVKPNFIRDPGEGQHEREPFYLFVGRLSVEKGVEVMLNAFSGMPNREIRIVGEGPLEESLKHKFSQYS